MCPSVRGIDVDVGDPVLRIGAAGADLGGKPAPVGGEVANATDPGEQPADRGRAVGLLRIENDRRRKAGGQGGLQGVGQPVPILVVEGQRPGAPDRRGGGSPQRTVPTADTVHQGEEEESADHRESQGPGDTVTQMVMQRGGSISGICEPISGISRYP